MRRCIGSNVRRLLVTVARCNRKHSSSARDRSHTTFGEHETSDQLYMPVYKGEYEVSAFGASLGFIGKFGK